MQSMSKGRYTLRIAETAADLAAAQRLRWLCFRGSNAGAGAAGVGSGAGIDFDRAAEALDADGYDARCTHVLIEEAASGRLVACFRMFELTGGAEIGQSYSAQYYNLSLLQGYDGRMVEIGRFCLHPEWHDPDIVRLAWGALARHVDAHQVGMLFGCSSFHGTATEAYEDAFAMLRERHLAPKRWLPRVKAPQIFRFARALRARKADPKRAMAAMPPLLRSYLLMGGWVSDHAVVDRQMNTLHVFTGLEIAAIPPARAQLMRAAAG